MKYTCDCGRHFIWENDWWPKKAGYVLCSECFPKRLVALGFGVMPAAVSAVVKAMRRKFEPNSYGPMFAWELKKWADEIEASYVRGGRAAPP